MYLLTLRLAEDNYANGLENYLLQPDLVYLQATQLISCDLISEVKSSRG